MCALITLEEYRGIRRQDEGPGRVCQTGIDKELALVEAKNLFTKAQPTNATYTKLTQGAFPQGVLGGAFRGCPFGRGGFPDEKGL